MARVEPRALTSSALRPQPAPQMIAAEATNLQRSAGEELALQWLAAAQKELDTSIQALTRSGADRAAVLKLSGIYHNLLRRWAQT